MSNYNHVVYTDGSALGQDDKFKTGEPVKGGYGYRILKPDGGILSDGGGSECSMGVTNNRMEMMAVLQALRVIHSNKHLFTSRDAFIIKTDSKYVRDCYHEYLPNWKRNNWKKKKGPIMNLDLWKSLDKASEYVKFKIEWVKGHSDADSMDAFHNDAVDKIAGHWSAEAKPRPEEVQLEMKDVIAKPYESIHE